MALLFGICFIFYFFKLSAGHGLRENKVLTFLAKAYITRVNEAGTSGLTDCDEPRKNEELKILDEPTHLP